MGSTTHKVIDECMIKKTFINNNIFSGCLHSRGVVLHFHLGLQDNTPIPAIEVMRYGPLQLDPNFPHAGFFAVPKNFLNTKSLGASGLSFTLASYPYLSLC